MGIPESEIANIHTANTEAAKKELFGKVRNGQIRVLIGSTQKMGAGTNVQKLLVALHHLDCLLTCNSGRGASSGRATKTGWWTSTPMSPKTPSTAIFTSW